MRNGWFRDSYRHSLAARGIKTSYAMRRERIWRPDLKQFENVLIFTGPNSLEEAQRHAKRNSFMAAKFIIPHWLLDKLDPDQKKEAEKMLFEDGEKVGAVAKYFDVETPYNKGGTQHIRWSDEQKKDFILELANKLGKTPSLREFEEAREVSVPTYTAFYHKFGTWNNMMKDFGLEPNFAPEKTTVSEKIEKLGFVPNQEQILREGERQYYAENKDILNKQNKEYREEHREEIAARERERYQDSEVRARMLEGNKQYRQEHADELSKIQDVRRSTPEYPELKTELKEAIKAGLILDENVVEGE